MRCWLDREPACVETLDERLVLVETASGEALILKDRGEGADARAEQLEFHGNVMRHLDERGIAVPQPRRARTGRVWAESGGRVYTLSRFLPGGHTALEPEQRAAFYGNAGRAVAELHTALASYPTAGVEVKSWREHLPSRWETWVSELKGRLTGRQLASLDDVVAQVGDIKPALENLPEQVIHRDCHAGNLVRHDANVVGFIDCDHFCLGPRVFDIAYFVVNDVKFAIHDDDATEAWLRRLPNFVRGYHERGALTPRECDALPSVLLCIPILFAWWFTIQDAHDLVQTDIDAMEWITRNAGRIEAACRVG